MVQTQSITGLPDWPKVQANSFLTANIRTVPEDFRVDEELAFSPNGVGEHLLLKIQKRNRNTEQTARLLAHHACVRQRDVGYCGLKDRNAITTQWFSIWLPGKPEPDWSLIENEDIQVLEQIRHRRKIQRGALQSNRFEIVLREIQGNKEELEKRLNSIKTQGVPNYFGEQRFGHDGGNLLAAKTMFDGKKINDRHLRSLYLSAARSFLFNEVLAERVKKGNWNQILPGEAVILAGSRSYFVCDKIDNEINERLKKDDIHPSGVLWGKGKTIPRLEAGDLEDSVLAPCSQYCKGLEKAKLKQERRALRLLVNDLHWNWLTINDAEALRLIFSLPAGAYATSVLREIASIYAVNFQNKHK